MRLQHIDDEGQELADGDCSVRGRWQARTGRGSESCGYDNLRFHGIEMTADVSNARQWRAGALRHSCGAY